MLLLVGTSIKRNNFAQITSIGGLVVKLAVAIHHRTVSASPGFDSRPMHYFCHSTRCCGGCRAVGRVLVEFEEVWDTLDIWVCAHVLPLICTHQDLLNIWLMH